MKKILLLLIGCFGLLNIGVAQTCISDTLYFTTQGQVDNFSINYPGCTDVEGSLYFIGNDNGDITNLNGLSQIITIGGDLTLRNTFALENLSGLENLQSIGGYLHIAENTVLTDISALNNLYDLDTDLWIAYNPALVHISGFNQLINFQGSIGIEGNQNLISVDGFNGITNNYSIVFNDNNSLTEINGFNSLTTIERYLNIYLNDNLVIVDAFAQLMSIGETLAIWGNFLLGDLSGFGSLTTIGTDFQLENSIALADMDNFTSLTTVGGYLRVKDNESLVSLTPSNILTEVGGDIRVINNAALTDISGFGNLTKVNGNFELRNNDALTDLTGVNNIASVEYLFLSQNELLSDLTPFSSLDSIHNTLGCDRNPSLINFTGLSSLDYMLNLSVTGTESNTSGIQDFTGLEWANTLGSVSVEDNGGLLSFNGLNNLTTITNSLTINNNNNLVDFSGLNNLSTLSNMTIFGNENITNFNGFDNLTTVANWLHISGNGSVINFEGLNNLNAVAWLSITGNASLTNFSGLNNLTEIMDRFDVEANASLVNFEGLESLQVLNNDLNINGNWSLVNLSGLESLVEIDKSILIRQNLELIDLSAIANLTLIGILDTLSLSGNESLEVCGQENICNYIMSGGPATIELNGPGCSNMNELIESCFVAADHTSLVGNVYTDLDQNCIESTGDSGIPNVLVRVENAEYSYGVTADDLGNYWLPVLEGEYTLNAVSPSNFWEPCFEDSIIVATAMNDTILTDLFLSPLGDCPYIDWDASLPPLRICASRDLVIDFCNYGAFPAEDAIFLVQLDPFLTLDSASMPYTVDVDGNILFDLETIDLFECGQIVMSVFLDCDSVELNDIQCVQVDLLSDELCDPSTLWDGSIVKASGYCEGDSIFFALENIGAGNMDESAQFRVDILIDDIVLLHDADDFQLGMGDTEILSYAIVDSDGFYLEADQTTGFPLDIEASAVVPNCNDMQNDTILTLFPLEDGDPFSETFCAIAVGSYDPNIKTARPVGVGPNHEIDKDWELDYTIQFQNTGNDVAYIVVIKDTLSDNVDLNSIRVKGASHDFTWALNPARELVFTFNNINLPDSTSNEPESHGHVSYSVKANSDILPGELIENRAGIYFDFNDPIITNTVFHTIRKPVVVNVEHQSICAGSLFLGHLILEDTSLQELTSFIEYDSIHFYHLNVLAQTTNEVTTSVGIGDYFEGILIEGDTIFEVSYTGVNGCDSLVTYTISGLVNTAELNDAFSQVQIFPNPVSKMLQVRNQQSSLVQEWRLVNVLGQVVWEQNIEPHEALDGVLVEGFSAGVYWLEVQTTQGSGVWRIVVE